MRYRCIDRVVQRQCNVTSNFTSNAVRKIQPKYGYCARRMSLISGQHIRFSSSTAGTAEGPKLPKVSATEHMRSTAKLRDMVTLLWRVIEEKRNSLVNPFRGASIEITHHQTDKDASRQTSGDKVTTSETRIVEIADNDILKPNQTPGNYRKSDQSLFEVTQKLSSYFRGILKISQTATVETPTLPHPSAVTPKKEPPTSTDLLKTPENKDPCVEAQSPVLKKSSAVTTRENSDNKTKYLLRAVASASSLVSRSTRIQEFCRHLHNNPQAKSLAIKEKGIPVMLRLKLVTKDETVQSYINEALALLGHLPPLPKRGIRILSIDGGGIRGIMAIEILRSLEQVTKQPVYQLFDYMCGVSTGAILTVLLGAMKMSMDECEEMYKRTSTQVFTQNSWWGTGQLVLNHAYYDTNTWAKQLKQIVGESQLIQTARDPDCPKIAAISTVVNQSRLLPFIFRNYDYPLRRQSSYPGTYSPQLWEAIRASAAAPGYFEEFTHGEFVHQDGGVLNNNPAALAIHECRHLWPNESIQCVVSIGNGRYEPSVESGPITSSSLRTKLLKIIDSATDTEGVHTILSDLLPPSRYYRFNPYLSAAVSLDEIKPEKFKQLHDDSLMYLRKNESKIQRSAEMLLESRSTLQKLRDNAKLKFETYI